MTVKRSGKGKLECRLSSLPFKNAAGMKKERKDDMHCFILNHFLNKAEKIAVFFCGIQFCFCGWEMIRYQASCRSRVCRLNMGCVCFHSHSNCQFCLSMSTFHGTLYSILNYYTLQQFWKTVEAWGRIFSLQDKHLAKHLDSLYFKHARNS